MDRKRSERLFAIRKGEASRRSDSADDRRFTSREDIVAAFADAPKIDFQRFRADIDAIVDPAPRCWPES